MNTLIAKLKQAIETNNRIANSKKETERLAEEIKNSDGIVKLMMMDTTLKQMRIDALKSELENSVEIDIPEIEKEILVAFGVTPQN